MAVNDETVGHLLCKCSKMARMRYKHRKDNVARIAHWSVAKQYGVDVAEKWYEYKPDPAIETATIKLLWDFTTIQTDRENPRRETGHSTGKQERE